ncbi:MAG TPA: ATP-binding protein [Vicinamibacterales bacterium]|nr:ATP-binding protein [Vicinamibacterales bacterium]
MTLPLRVRLSVAYTAIFGLLIVLLGLVFYRALDRQLDDDATARLTGLTAGLHGYLHFEGATPLVIYDPDDDDQAAFVQEATRYFQIYDATSGALLTQSDALAPLALRFTPQEVRDFCEQPGTHDFDTDHGAIRLLSSVITPDSGGRYLLQVGVSLTANSSTLTRFREMLLWGVPAALFIGAVVGWWLAGWGLAPIARVADAARHIDLSTLEQRLPVRGTRDELDEVADAFNDTLGRLQRAILEMRQFSTALAHELRTPLAALRGEIELSLLQRPETERSQCRRESQLEEIDRLKRFIDQVLTLARAEGGEIPLARERVELGPLAAALVEQLDLVAQARQVQLDYRAEVSAAVEGDREWLGRAVLNLIDNALKFTPAGGRVTVAVSRAEGGAFLEVRDSGIGIAPDAVRHLFTPFFRADPARSSAYAGAGVGLSLVKWIVTRHRGTVDVASRPAGGSVFTIHLPAVD